MMTVPETHLVSDEFRSLKLGRPAMKVFADNGSIDIVTISPGKTYLSGNDGTKYLLPLYKW